MSYTQADTQKMLTEIANAWNEQFASFRGKIDNRLEGQDKDYDELKKQMDAIETAIALGQFPGGSSRRDGVSLSAAAKEHKEAFLAWVRKGVNPEGLRDLEVRRIFPPSPIRTRDISFTKRWKRASSGWPRMP
jgi:hypothetical protein